MVKKKTPSSLDKNDQFDSLLPTENLMNFLRNEFGERVKNEYLLHSEDGKDDEEYSAIDEEAYLSGIKT